MAGAIAHIGVLASALSNGRARAPRESRLSRCNDGQAALLAGASSEAKVSNAFANPQRALCPVFSRRLPAPASSNAGRRQPGVPDGSGTRLGFSFALRSGFFEAADKFDNWESQHPEEPFGEVAVAASYLFEELSARGCSPAISSSMRRDSLHGIEGKPESGADEAFSGRADQARKNSPRTAWQKTTAT